ncbi:MAG: hypothetical protein WD042_04460 [Phycisphaeraceae bacterium]
MPRVDVHMHLNGRDPDQAVEQCLAIMDRVGIDVAVVLSPRANLVAQMSRIREQSKGRVLLAPRPGPRQAPWMSREELTALKEAGAVGMKIWVGYSQVITREEFGRSLAHQGEVGLPVIGMHIADPPSGKTPPERFEAQIAHALAHVQANPGTTFIMAHGFWLMTQDKWLDRLDDYFTRYPNLYVDLAATAQAFGGQTLSYDRLRHFMIRWQDRLLFGTDGNEQYSQEDRYYFYWFRLLETRQPGLRGFFGGDINIQGLALPLETLNHIYWWNAARLIPAVRQSLIARGYLLDVPTAYTPPPGIVSTEACALGAGQVQLTVETDSPARVRWSFSDHLYARMSGDRVLSGDATRHHALISAGDAKAIYVSAAHQEGHAMPVATAVDLPGGAAERAGANAGQAGSALAYQVVAWEEFGQSHSESGFRVKAHAAPIREVYIRFRARMSEVPVEPAPLWQLAFEPVQAHAPEHHVQANAGRDAYEAVFNLHDPMTISSVNLIKPGQWQEHVIRLDLHRNLFKVEVDGRLVMESQQRQLAGMWGGGFDAVRIAEGTRGNVAVDDVLILAGRGAFSFDGSMLPDRQPPVVTEVFPLDGDVNVDPRAAVIAGFADLGIGLNSEAVVLELNGSRVKAEVVGRLQGGYVVFNPSKDLPPGRMVARLQVADMSKPPNRAEKTWSFGVAEHSGTADERNLALHRAPLVDSTYVDERDPYTPASLTDGHINPQGGSSASWASGSPGREDQWVAIDLGEARPVAKVRVYPVLNNGVYMTPRVLIVDAWDGTNYQPIAATYSSRPSADVTICFPAVTTQRLRVRRPPFLNPLLWLTEVEVYGPSN